MFVTFLRMNPFYIDRYYLILILPCLLFSMIAQGLVKSSFNKYSKIQNARGLTGYDVAQKILYSYDIRQVRVERIAGQLTDHYSPNEQVLRLSDSVYDSSSIAALGVAAHEAGHAIQFEQGYLPGKIRRALVPVAQIGSNAGPLLAILGLAFSWGLLTKIGIILYTGAVLFFLVTLPVEFNASARAVQILDNGYLSQEELKGAKSVLRAAALTYVASAASAIASLMRLVLLDRDRRR